MTFDSSVRNGTKLLHVAINSVPSLPRQTYNRLVMKNITLPIVVEADADGYFVSCPALQGCYSQGDSYEEAVQNIKDAIRLHVEDRLADGEEIPQVSVSLSTVEIAV